MAEITSTSTGGNWATGATWVGGVAPSVISPGDDVVIATTGSGKVTLPSGEVWANSLTISGGHLNISGASAKLHLETALTLSNGNLTLSNTNAINGILCSAGVFISTDGTSRIANSNCLVLPADAIVVLSTGAILSLEVAEGQSPMILANNIPTITNPTVYTGFRTSLDTTIIISSELNINPCDYSQNTTTNTFPYIRAYINGVVVPGTFTITMLADFSGYNNAKCTFYPDADWLAGDFLEIIIGRRTAATDTPASTWVFDKYSCNLGLSVGGYDGFSFQPALVGSKMDLADSLNGLAVTAIQNGLLKAVDAISGDELTTIVNDIETAVNSVHTNPYNLIP
jgi:hypothetical protein